MSAKIFYSLEELQLHVCRFGGTVTRVNREKGFYVWEA